jgi:hypothetical protein
MKKILIFLLLTISVKCFSQLENIKIANFSLQSRDLEQVAGSMVNGTDETFEMFQRFRVAYRAAMPLNPTTPVAADTVSAQALFDLYRFAYSEPTYVTDANSKRIINAIKGVVNTPLQTAITLFENEFAQVVIGRRLLGRKKLSGQ